MNVDSDECNFLLMRRLLETPTVKIGSGNEKAPALTAEYAVAAEKIITYKQAIARVQVVCERQHVVVREISGSAYPRSNVNPICLPSFLRVLSGLGGERFSWFSRCCCGNGEDVFYSTLSLSGRKRRA
ncbi:MAG: hypothetical protein OET44_21105 [Gammaproteobacteria bacterium]|nr:hypothetical protein [Gammaproteobacteria bacterium]